MVQRALNAVFRQRILHDGCQARSDHQKVADDMIYMTHPGKEEHFEPSKLAVDTFGEVVGFNGYEFKDMAKEEQTLMWDGKETMFHYRLFCKCRELDWKQAIKEGRNFHNYRGCVRNNTRDYVTEKQILLGKPVPAGREGYEIPEFP